jgi:hypothetical protein
MGAGAGRGVGGESESWTSCRAEIAKIVAHVKASAGKAPAGKPVAVVDGDTALAEVTQLLGSAPESCSGSERTSTT